MSSRAKATLVTIRRADELVYIHDWDVAARVVPTAPLPAEGSCQRRLRAA